jgi:hypothetical protein
MNTLVVYLIFLGGQFWLQRFFCFFNTEHRSGISFIFLGDEKHERQVIRSWLKQ